MKKLIMILYLCAVSSVSFAYDWKASWISADACLDEPNTWINLQKNVSIESVPDKAVACIAADSKYWLWINGDMVVFEGGLKRGPNPRDTYYDEVDIAPWLKSGDNVISVLLCYFGKDGFSHKSSGRAGLLFDCRAGGVEILSDTTWRCMINPAYQTCGDPRPNYRLSESSILFDGRKSCGKWFEGSVADDYPNAVAVGSAGDAPWNSLVKRPVPLWKFSEVKSYAGVYHSGDSLVGILPYNAQVTPVIRVKAPAGQRIVIGTDNYFYYNGSTENIRTEYITTDGEQEYEALGWMNGHRVYYVIPEDVDVLSVGYRESGYDCGFAGDFESSDTLLNKLWEKSRRTLYVTMRDTYMDCPERERAQWAGDAVNESGEAFYALSVESHELTRKWLLETAFWQRDDSVVYAPVPAGNWNTELPGQSLAAIGYFGAWNYYMHTGDLMTLRMVYPAFKRYLSRWFSESGMAEMPEDVWLWGDWGDNRDMYLLINAWYYLALKGMGLMASELGYPDDSACYAGYMEKIRDCFNSEYWNGKAYRTPTYKGAVDDRVQALAVVSGIAGEDKYPALLDVFKTEFHASPYMEKYVFEAMMQMNYVDEALSRHKSRLKNMVENPYFTTLFEHWNVGIDGFGGGSVNHAWTGGGLTVLSEYLCGISPASAGYEKVEIMPRPGSMEWASARVMSVKGSIKSSFRRNGGCMNYTFEIPYVIKAAVGIPLAGDIGSIRINNVVVWADGKYIDNDLTVPCNDCGGVTHVGFELPGGIYEVTAE